jgi:DNA-binding NarL/FixJ family response regulator
VPANVDKIRVVLADDHPRILASLRSILAEEFEVVAAAMAVKPWSLFLN